MPPVRRLTAILAADVAGYSRLMGADEEGTHERLKAHLRELVDPKIAEHRGRIVKNTGDGFLAEFSSVIDAVRCGVEVSRGMATANAAVPPDGRIEFRIGVNLGDVIAEEHDIFGDGVNVAARLEALAEPGGICISRVVRDQIRDKLPYSFEDMGELSVKNIARPVRVYALRGTEAVGDRRSSSAPFSRSVSKPAEAPRLSIVVLPFANLSNDPEQQYFADGITEDLTTDLSRIAHMFVISRNTAFTYRNKPVDTKKIGHELSVRYVLEGSARRLGQVVRVNAQLIDAETDAHLWAERFDGDAGDLFAMQNTITRRIAGAVDAELITAEARRLAEHPDALDYILRGRSAYNQWPIRDNYTQAVRMFEQALALNPQSVEAQTWIAHVLATRVLRQQTNAPAADIERAAELIEQALAASPRSTHAHFVKGQVLRTQYRFEDAIPEFETVIASDPNHASAYANLGLCKFVTGSVEELIPLQERALGLDPGDPFVATVYFRIGLAHFLQSHYEDAIIAFQKASVGRSAGVADAHSFLAALYALQGKTEHAAAELAEARRLGSDNRYSSIACLKAVGFGAIPNNFRAPKIQTLLEGTYYAGLRKAGMPEE